jgi:predicted RNase H-like nuclease (RuvC/YqgF family)
MRKITDELRALRRQMEEDFLLHTERATAQKQALSRLERTVERAQESISQLQASFSEMRKEFSEFGEATATYDDTWHIERRRNLQVLDLIQANLVTGGVETETRFDHIEQRLGRIERQLGVA